MKKLIESIVDWVYPPRCMSCKNPLPLQDTHMRGLWLCGYCEKLFVPIEGPRCEVCSAPVIAGVLVCVSCNGKDYWFAKNKSAFAYAGIMRDMIRDLKFRRRRHVAWGLGRLWAKQIDIPADVILVPLPLHRAKQKERGYNQAYILAKAISEVTGHTMANVLARTRDTPPQSGLHPQLRKENVMGAFNVISDNIGNKCFAVVDDIYTTGASINECAKVLMGAGARKVYALTLAITVKKDPEQEDN